MTSLSRTASWVIVRLSDGEAMFETFNRRIAEAINRDRYKAVPILQHLQTLNASIKAMEDKQ